MPWVESFPPSLHARDALVDLVVRLLLRLARLRRRRRRRWLVPQKIVSARSARIIHAHGSAPFTSFPAPSTPLACRGAVSVFPATLRSAGRPPRRPWRRFARVSAAFRDRAERASAVRTGHCRSHSEPG